MSINKLIITGFARTGTTALMDFLNRDEKIFLTCETHSFTKDKPVNASRIAWPRIQDLLKERGINVPNLEGMSCQELYQYLLDNGMRYVGDKSNRPFLSKMLDVPAIILVCIRDMRDTLTSEFFKNDGRPVQQLLNMYHDIIEKLLPRPNVFFLKYEDITLDPSYTRKKLSQILGVPLNIKYHNFKPVHVGRWKETGFKSTPELDKLLTFFGYEV
jgi:hypothetical protein